MFLPIIMVFVIQILCTWCEYTTANKQCLKQHVNFIHRGICTSYMMLNHRLRLDQTLRCLFFWILCFLDKMGGDRLGNGLGGIAVTVYALCMLSTHRATPKDPESLWEDLHQSHMMKKGVMKVHLL